MITCSIAAHSHAPQLAEKVVLGIWVVSLSLAFSMPSTVSPFNAPSLTPSL
jgi:hypothetical protein